MSDDPTVGDTPVVPGYRPDPPETHPPLDFPGYKSTALRHPKQPLLMLPHGLTEITGPVLGSDLVRPGDHDLTFRHRADPIGQKIIVFGRLLDGDGRPIPDSLIEIWQANAAGRYRHLGDRWDAPLDPNFDGVGRTLTDKQGRYEFVSIQPGAYPWGNHHNAWRPAHIHFSVFGRAFPQRLVTQMYFPGDPLFFQDPIFNSIPEAARPRLISRFSLERTKPNWALAYEFDIVLRGRAATPFEEPHHD
ncbi:Protocatechuate 3,4-dioxygenase beta chain [Nocardia sp. RB56]|uniref:Protocatechuate 3,4-dioxygenase beta chain n=1 Tax=Nocardia aurantia TaxID=2585199 RepID=A0A7K0DWQ5_9NOCA|nr:protocatechuate 3,4-dioxygenase subunit beta [Nocardia aurantia]MQY29264.1 Protocatechuate 3,4-dioxygenase beta chain [Nocardia aurantia]